MTTRDRLVLMGLVTLGLLAAGWLLVVSPERKKAAQLDGQVSAAKTQLASAQTQLSEAQGAQAQYSTAYSSIVRLGQAVPADQQVPSLVYELDQASNGKNVEFNSITTSAGATTAGAPAPAAAAAPAAAGASAAASSGFTQMPFTFVFEGTFVDLYHLLNQVQGFTVQSANGTVQVSGRLLTIQGASLELPSGGATSEASSAKSSSSAGSSSSPSASSAAKTAEQSKLKGTITATAYVLPAGQSATAGATPAGPAGAPTTAVSGPSASSPSTAPAAVVKAIP
jgi:Type II secretion system (T2SS), protein M